MAPELASGLSASVIAASGATGGGARGATTLSASSSVIGVGGRPGVSSGGDSSTGDAGSIRSTETVTSYKVGGAVGEYEKAAMGMIPVSLYQCSGDI